MGGEDTVNPPAPDTSPLSESPLSVAEERELLEEEEVMSEVHLGCPPNFSGPFISHFTFSLPSHGKASPLLHFMVGICNRHSFLCGI